MEIINWIVANYLTIITTILTVIGGASVAIHAIAPFTSTTVDDEAATFIDKVYAFLSKWVALNPTPKK